MATYYGKYRASVLNNIDPLQIGRLMVQVPDVAGLLPSTWAMPCLPFSGTGSGFFVLPEVGSGVWVEFEQGNVDYPIWVGCYWSAAADLPPLALAAPPGVQQVVIQTTEENTFVVSDVPGPTGGILLKTSAGAFISISDTGIVIDNGQGASITLNGPAVNVNEGAMEVI